MTSLAGVVLHDHDALLGRGLQRRNLRVGNPDRDRDTVDALGDRLVDQGHQIGAEVVVVRYAQIVHGAAVGLDHQGRIVHALLDQVEEAIFDRSGDHGDVLRIERRWTYSAADGGQRRWSW